MTTNTAVVGAMIHGRRADSTRRRQRVLSALDNAITDGAELSVTDIARRAGVDRTFLYRHRDLLERIHTADAQPPDKPEIGPRVTRASLQADLLAAAAAHVPEHGLNHLQPLAKLLHPGRDRPPDVV